MAGAPSFLKRFLEPFGFLDVFERQPSRVDQVRHDGSRTLPDYIQKVVDQSALRLFARNGSREDVAVRYTFKPVYRALALHAIDGGLNGGVRRSSLHRKRLLNLTD